MVYDRDYRADMWADIGRLINVPMGIIVLTLCLTLLKGRETETSPVKMNLPGLTLLVLGVGGLQIMLDKGRDLDWFNSSTIIILTVMSVISLISLVIWESTSENPILDLSLFKSRKYHMRIFILLWGDSPYAAVTPGNDGV